MLPVPSSPPRQRSPCDAPFATIVEGNTSIWLPRDVISEVLRRLPVKSLCRFRCVSRGWCALISDPILVSEHKTRSKPLIVASYLEKNSLRLIDMEGNIVRVIRGECSFKKSICSRADDLACLFYGLDGAKVIDLATGEVLATGSGGRPLGFGRAVPSGLYKLLMFRYGKYEILTVGDHVGWRRKKSLRSIHIIHYSDTITIDGVAYLFVQEEINIIVPFDLESEEWRKGIRGPPISKERWIKISLAELNGFLCVGTTADRKTYGVWEIWRLADSVNSIWVKAYTIPSCAYSELMPLKVLCGSKKLLFYGFRGVGPVLQIYDPDDGTCMEVAKLPSDYTWTISLCSLHLERFVGVNI